LDFYCASSLKHNDYHTFHVNWIFIEPLRCSSRVW